MTMSYRVAHGKMLGKGDLVALDNFGCARPANFGDDILGIVHRAEKGMVSVVKNGTFVMQSPAEALCEAAREIAAREDAEAANAFLREQYGNLAPQYVSGYPSTTPELRNYKP